MTALTKSRENKKPSLGVVFNDGSLTMFYVYNEAEIEKRGPKPQGKDWEIY